MSHDAERRRASAAGRRCGASAYRAGSGPTRSRARLVAYEVLEAVRESDAYANLLLPARIQRAKLSEADAGLATELTYGTLRRQGTYDAVIELAAGRPVDAIDRPRSTCCGSASTSCSPRASPRTPR